MQITIYAPDRHFIYDGTLPDRSGVGGGLTARVRIAAALARRGHAVTVVCNCPGEVTHERVRYVPLGSVASIECDALLIHSSGGAGVTSLTELSARARVRVVVISGPDLPAGTESLRPDAIYACSNFIRTQVWRYPFVSRERIFVAYYGVNRWNRTGLRSPLRSARRLIYSSHPSKGLDAARAVWQRLRAKDKRFTLHCFGGNQLWGGVEEQTAGAEPGYFYGGLINQRALAREYMRSAFALQLQTRAEPFGITVVEAMAAGCLVVASPVGAFPELIEHGRNGFLVDGDPAEAATVGRAAALIWNVHQDADLMHKVRRAAYQTPFTWETLAEVWEAHLLWLMDRKSQRRLERDWARCLECAGATLSLADGYHCIECGLFARHAAPAGGKRNGSDR